MSDIDTVVVDSLKALDPNRPIREADIRHEGTLVSLVAFYDGLTENGRAGIKEQNNDSHPQLAFCHCAHTNPCRCIRPCRALSM